MFGSHARPVEFDVSRRQVFAAAAPACAGSVRQGHGLSFELRMSALLGLWRPDCPTAKWDAFEADPGLVAVALPFSMKTAGSRNGVDLGSLARQGAVVSDFVMYVGRWSRRTDHLTAVYVLSVPAELWRSLWPADLSPFSRSAVFDGISNDRADDGRWRVRRAGKQAEWVAALPAGSPMRVRFKRDHKRQRRVQCSIANAGFLPLFERCFDPVRTAQLERLLDR